MSVANTAGNAIVVQLVVRHLAKVEVASSSLVYRSSNPEIQRQISGFLFADRSKTRGGGSRFFGDEGNETISGRD